MPRLISLKAPCTCERASQDAPSTWLISAAIRCRAAALGRTGKRHFDIGSFPCPFDGLTNRIRVLADCRPMDFGQNDDGQSAANNGLLVREIPVAGNKDVEAIGLR